VLARDIPPRLTGTYRMGDIRHCYADVGKAHRVLDYQPRVSFEDGLRDLAHWLEQEAVALAAAPQEDGAEQALQELAARGLSIAAPAGHQRACGSAHAPSGDAGRACIGPAATITAGGAASESEQERVLQ
jgi:hypothetical protein